MQKETLEGLILNDGHLNLPKVIVSVNEAVDATGHKLKEGYYRRENPLDSSQAEYYRYDTDEIEKHLNEYSLVAQLESMNNTRTIKNCVLFFTGLFVLALIVSIFMILTVQ